MTAPFALTETTTDLAPLVVDSPHSGRHYPDDFKFSCPLKSLRQAEDFMVDELIAGAVHAGAAVLRAEFPRSYIDLNRAEDDIDPAVLAEAWPTSLAPGDRTLIGLGLVRRMCRSGMPVYSAPLPVAEVQKRIETVYRPYHAALEDAMTKRMQMFGHCVLIDVHSMPARRNEGGSFRHDFVLGDRQGTSCEPSLTRHVQHILQDLGFSVALNDPFKGAEIVSRHGNPQQGRQALQLEINRRLYMNEDSLTLHEGFTRLQQLLAQFFKTFVVELSRDEPALAAE